VLYSDKVSLSANVAFVKHKIIEVRACIPPHNDGKIIDISFAEYGTVVSFCTLDIIHLSSVLKSHFIKSFCLQNKDCWFCCDELVAVCLVKQNWHLGDYSFPGCDAVPLSEYFLTFEGS
jgi:hypothetical protein